MSFAQDWKTAKTNFETATNKKKPSEKFLGILGSKGSGIGSAAKDLDTSLDSPTMASTEKALTAFRKEADAYVKVLQKAAKDEKYTGNAAELKKLEDALDTIGGDFLKARSVALSTAPRPLSDVMGSLFTKITDPVLMSKPSVKWFGSIKAAGKSILDGATLSDAAAFHKKWITDMNSYKKGMEEFKAKGKTEVTEKTAKKLALQLADKIEVSLSIDGAPGKFMEWFSEQTEYIKSTGKFKDINVFLAGWSDRAKWEMLGKDMQDESVRINDLLHEIGQIG